MISCEEGKTVVKGNYEEIFADVCTLLMAVGDSLVKETDVEPYAFFYCIGEMMQEGADGKSPAVVGHDMVSLANQITDGLRDGLGAIHEEETGMYGSVSYDNRIITDLFAGSNGKNKGGLKGWKNRK